MTLGFVALFIFALVTSLLATSAARRMALRWGLMDQPGLRKVHELPMPRNGGIGIFAGIALPMIAAMVAVLLMPQRTGGESSHTTMALLYRHLPGLRAHLPLALLLLGCTLGIHVLGLWDDRKALAPWPKLLGQLLLAALLVVLGEGVQPGAFRTLTVLEKWVPVPYVGWVLSAGMTVIWIVAVTNAFNFLDHMDGLSAGVALIAGVMFLVAAALAGQWFVCGLLAVFLGAVAGFLFHNFPPAIIFMGDGGSLVLGFFLAALTIRTTYVPPAVGEAASGGGGGGGGTGGGGWYSVLAPVIILAVPLYDMIIVSVLRISRGRSPMTGDTNHFSHRLVRAGFSKRSAVLVIYAVTLALGISAPLLSRADNDTTALLIALQVLAMLVVIGILERVGEHTK
ncbi:MAG: MraY family glycosyltransferase [Phycisphaerae bacterium]